MRNHAYMLHYHLQLFQESCRWNQQKQSRIFLKEEYQRDERIKSMKAMNIIREFEVQRKKDSENVKEYLDRLLSIVIKVRMLGNKFPDNREV